MGRVNYQNMQSNKLAKKKTNVMPPDKSNF